MLRGVTQRKERLKERLRFIKRRMGREKVKIEMIKKEATNVVRAGFNLESTKVTDVFCSKSPSPP